jgi:hypothetical protein
MKKTKRRFEGTCDSHLQGWRVSHARNQHAASRALLKMGQHAPPKCQLTFNGLVYHKIELPWNTAMRTSKSYRHICYTLNKYNGQWSLIRSPMMSVFSRTLAEITEVLGLRKRSYLLLPLMCRAYRSVLARVTDTQLLERALSDEIQVDKLSSVERMRDALNLTMRASRLRC